jgi:RimJ/RimL family protein N-acetyltransferase
VAARTSSDRFDVPYKTMDMTAKDVTGARVAGSGRAGSRSWEHAAVTWTLETARLRLRPMGLDDVDAIHAVLGDPVSMRFYPRPFTREMARAWIERSLERYGRDGFGLLAIEERDTGEVIGDCGPTTQSVDGDVFVELGWHVRRDRQRRGFASEAGAACRDEAWRVLGPELLISLIRPENVASWSVARTLGFHPWRGTVRAGMGHVVWRLDHPVVGSA